MNQPDESIRDVIGPGHRTDPDVLKAFQDLIDGSMPRIREAVFVQYLLPLSYPEEGVEKHPYNWRVAAGSMSNGIHVTNTKDEVLFTCPGLFPEFPMARERGEDLRWAELARDAVEQNDRHPGLGEERLANIGLKYLPDATPTQVTAHRDAWIEVWKRYSVNGYSPGDTTPTIGPVPSAPSAGALIEADEDDEF